MVKDREERTLADCFRRMKIFINLNQRQTLKSNMVKNYRERKLK
jgi:hypothetical protein